ncbi:MAG: cell division protein FtsW [Chlamydiia bacterium]|nr:cell division protein FtsW [Chlamydiia bacterium]
MSRIAIWLITSVALIFSLGLVMIYNTTAAEIIDHLDTASLHAALVKQGLYGCVGLGLGWIAYSCGYEWILRHSVFLLILTTVLLILVFIPGIGLHINGARRWIGLFGYSFQPSESVKILIPAVYIHWVTKRETAIDFAAFFKLLAAFAIPMGLILMEPDTGTTILICTLLVALFFLTRIRLFYWGVPLAILVGLGVVVASQMPHVRSRLQVYLHPELDLRGKGHQPHQAKIAAGSGQLFGRGIGESLQKLNYLPEARSDYIAAIYAEETGFIGILLLIGLYASLGLAGIFIALGAKDREGFLLAAILTFSIAIQSFLNLGIVSTLLPSKGMTLPFFSQGGTSLMVNLIALFILLDIARKTEAVSHEQVH